VVADPAPDQQGLTVIHLVEMKVARPSGDAKFQVSQ
jgi:hypothetical protein